MVMLGLGVGAGGLGFGVDLDEHASVTEEKKNKKLNHHRDPSTPADTPP